MPDGENALSAKEPQAADVADVQEAQPLPTDPEPEIAPALVPGRRGRRQQAATVVEVHPPAGPAQMRLRHRGLLLSFLLLVILPFLISAGYLWGVAQDQYASTVGFTVRREEGATSATELLGGLAQIGASSGSSETDILYEFIQSQEIIAQIDERIGLSDIYAEHWPADPLFALWPGATIEDLQWYWGRVVRISYDAGTHLIELNVLAPNAEDAQRIATEIVAASQRMINDLNVQARADTMRYANEDLASSIARLKAAREALSRFRTRTQIVDPQADIQGRMGVLNNLQQQLAQALIENDIVLGTTQDDDPRREQAARRIQVIRDRITAERQTFATSDDNGTVGENYPELLAAFEGLAVDLQFAEETYRASLAALDVARANASRQTMYLAPYVKPTLPQVAEYPQRFVMIGLIGMFLALAWSIMALIYYSVRDRR
ncbi:sugar transporter [Gemmobacter aquatilis]|nr:sugar transporter [Gemmobacter aquatilis]